ncbi:hypothetical protein BDP55DRAFT_631894 [Colletotrichum godetiae]|uniref:Uncharacterized protein n=1 Tax=Colletotrichum godetiae TaxID=1209918 RepID=A0AAJ0AKR9_9PEZI|nr:uncharacterized protein BDP55DRAFT_631894 [Colletotrichum godetiae]KAK1675701.1 hypothetical protein BDP55DRAFT_631894 [Colletotrichum godetiae]
MTPNECDMCVFAYCYNLRSWDGKVDCRFMSHVSQPTLKPNSPQLGGAEVPSLTFKFQQHVRFSITKSKSPHLPLSREPISTHLGTSTKAITFAKTLQPATVDHVTTAQKLARGFTIPLGANTLQAPNPNPTTSHRDKTATIRRRALHLRASHGAAQPFGQNHAHHGGRTPRARAVRVICYKAFEAGDVCAAVFGDGAPGGGRPGGGRDGRGGGGGGEVGLRPVAGPGFRGGGGCE